VTGHDDYLLDPKAPPDPEVEALERALRPLAWDGAPLRGGVPPAGAPRWRRIAPWLLAAALLAVTLVQVFAPRGAALHPEAPPRDFVAKGEDLRITLGDLAEITLRPGGELRFVHWRADQALFDLRQGSLEARVLPPPKVAPRFFVMDTPVGRLVDEGCRYELVVQAEKRAHVRVTEGAVTFAAGERTVFVPAGAGSIVTATAVATPMFVETDTLLRKAVREFDDARERKADLETRGITLKQVLAAARRPRDSLVLWHVLRDPEPAFRQAAEDHLRDLVGDPDGGKTQRETFDPEEWLAFLRLGAWQGGG
jgi:hypothetical protein